MGAFSPIVATYGSRVEQLLETPQDFQRYHEKLNRKLQKLRHKCQLVNKNTKKYSANEKYDKITSADYDKKSKLYGVLVLLHAERDLALSEMLKLRARQRGRFKSNEKKVVGTRLKKAVRTSQNLVELTINEKLWITRAQYLIYTRLAQAEYLLNGKFSKDKESGKIARNLAVCIAALSHLCKSDVLPETVFEFLQSKYDYSLKQHAGKIISASDLQNFIITQVRAAEQEDDELAKLILANGFKAELPDIEMEKGDSIKKIQYRAFIAQVNDPQVEQLINEAENNQSTSLSRFSEKLLKWQQALEKQEIRTSYHENEDDEEEGANSHENDQILLVYIKFNVLIASILRDDNLASRSGGFVAESYNEYERFIKNILKSLRDIMELPGVYSDDELMTQLQLCQAYYEAQVSYRLAMIHAAKYHYRNSLALYLHSLEILDNAVANAGEVTEYFLPGNLLTENTIGHLRNNIIMQKLKEVMALAEYENSVADVFRSPYDPSVIEQLGSGPIEPARIRLDNLFPLRPKMRPVQSKPSLFDLAFNYIDYESGSAPSNDYDNESKPVQDAEVEQDQEPTKKRGFLGLFGR